MKINAATDWSIIRTRKQPAIFDRCIFEQATREDMQKLNQKYAFVFPRVLLMECAKAENPKVIKNIERIEHFLLVSIYDHHISAADAIPCHTSEIMKKDLVISLLRQPEEDEHLVYFTPCDKQSLLSMISWAKIEAADEYYKDFSDFAQMFVGRKHTIRLEGLVENTQNYGWRHGKRYIPKDNIEKYWQAEIKAFKSEYGFNPFYGNHLKDVIGLAKISLEKTPMINIIENLSKVYRFDPSWPKKQIDSRPNYPHPDDYAKYSNYFYFILMCSVFGGFQMEKTYLRDWEYVYYLPFCQVMSADKRFFKNLRLAMRSVETDRILGIAIPDRIRIWKEDDI